MTVESGSDAKRAVSMSSNMIAVRYGLTDALYGTVIREGLELTEFAVG